MGVDHKGDGECLGRVKSPGWLADLEGDEPGEGSGTGHDGP